MCRLVTFAVVVSTAERRCIAVAEQECVSRRDEKGPARGPCHLAVSVPAVGCRRTWASVDGACSAGADSSHRSSRGCGRDDGDACMTLACECGLAMRPKRLSGFTDAMAGRAPHSSTGSHTQP
jgi:hypothetical protein